MSLFALVSYLVLLICCSAIRLLSRKCGIKLRVCSYGISQPIATKFDEKNNGHRVYQAIVLYCQNGEGKMRCLRL